MKVVLTLLTLFIVTDYLRTAFKSDVYGLPGPWIARFSSLYKLYMVYDGQCHVKNLDLHKKYGPMVRIGPRHVHISDPVAIPTIYSVSTNFVKGEFYLPFGFKYNGKLIDTLFATRDPVIHKRIRIPVSQMYSMTSVRTLEPAVDECSDIFLKAMHELEGQDIDFGAWLHWWAFDAVGAITFNKRFGFLEKHNDINGMIDSLKKALSYGSIISQVPSLHRYLIGNDTFLAMLKLLPGYFDPFGYMCSIATEELKRYDEENHGHRNDFLAWLKTDADKGKYNVSESDMIGYLLANLNAGSDTTAITLRAIFYYLMRNPQSFRKLHQEIDEADSGRRLSRHISYTESLQLPYLQAVMKEALRLHPAVAAPLERVVPPEGATVCGHFLEAGTIVGMNPWVVHRDTAVFGADAGSFRPERWIDSSEEQLKEMNRYFMAFGQGSRTCIGKNISLMEMGKIVPQILRDFDMEWASPEPDWTVTTHFFPMQDGLIVRLKPHKTEDGTMKLAI
ncbi:cytochrome P450 [Penicillium nucicola]|uniref:cytochrome P450 n=1 Tax=Penicillium nucicola TaxID=1850975 RepID=UPI002545741D|nr:cytochrome P450 [Penicillium nucicola]KAJ5770109.1 cytochrome P450 [Penicillium nucicola]